MENVNDSENGNIHGAILVNVTDKTIDEIEHIIETRRYGAYLHSDKRGRTQFVTTTGDESYL